MSNDLISRKAVLEILYDISSRNYGSLFGYGINRACDVIEHVETAFCKEKVIEELKGQIELVSYNPMTAGRYIKKNRAIEIVEKGGVK